MVESYVERWQRQQKERIAAERSEAARQGREASQQMVEKSTPKNEKGKVKENGTNSRSERQETPAE